MCKPTAEQGDPQCACHVHLQGGLLVDLNYTVGRMEEQVAQLTVRA